MVYMATFTINIPPMLAYIPYMDPMGCLNVNPLINLAFGGWVFQYVEIPLAHGGWTTRIPGLCSVKHIVTAPPRRWLISSPLPWRDKTSINGGESPFITITYDYI